MLSRVPTVFDGGGGRYGEKLTNLILSRHPRERLPSTTRIKVKSFRRIWKIRLDIVYQDGSKVNAFNDG